MFGKWKWGSHRSEGHTPGSCYKRETTSQRWDPAGMTWDPQDVQTYFQVPLEATGRLNYTVIPQGLGSLSLAASQECQCWSGERKWGTRPRTKVRTSQNGQMQGDPTGSFMVSHQILTEHSNQWEARAKNNAAIKWYWAALSLETRKWSTTSIGSSTTRIWIEVNWWCRRKTA